MIMVKVDHIYTGKLCAKNSGLAKRKTDKATGIFHHLDDNK